MDQKLLQASGTWKREICVAQSLGAERDRAIGLFKQTSALQFQNEKNYSGSLGGSGVEHLPWAQVVTLESWDRVLHQVPCREPASPSAFVSASLSLAVSLMNK